MQHMYSIVHLFKKVANIYLHLVSYASQHKHLFKMVQCIILTPPPTFHNFYSLFH